MSYLDRPTVERVNASAPQHSRIFKEVSSSYYTSDPVRFALCSLPVEMILVTSPGKPVQYTLKGFPRRQVILKQYEEEINGIYDRAENIPVDSQQGIQHWTPDSTLIFVRETVHGVMKQKISDDDDFFQFGCDR